MNRFCESIQFLTIVHNSITVWQAHYGCFVYAHFGKLGLIAIASFTKGLLSSI